MRTRTSCIFPRWHCGATCRQRQRLVPREPCCWQRARRHSGCKLRSSRPIAWQPSERRWQQQHPSTSACAAGAEGSGAARRTGKLRMTWPNDDAGSTRLVGINKNGPGLEARSALPQGLEAQRSLHSCIGIVGFFSIIMSSSTHFTHYLLTLQQQQLLFTHHAKLHNKSHNIFYRAQESKCRLPARSIISNSPSAR